MPHWVKYKDEYFNMSRIRGFRIDRWKKTGDAVMYTGDLKVDKSRPFVVYADMHNPMATFKTKAEAHRFIEEILDGKYDVKK